MYYITAGDLCRSRLHSCSSNAICTNLRNGYSCSCKQGYSGDGYFCTGKNVTVVENSLTKKLILIDDSKTNVENDFF